MDITVSRLVVFELGLFTLGSTLLFLGLIWTLFKLLFNFESFKNIYFINLNLIKEEKCFGKAQLLAH